MVGVTMKYKLFLAYPLLKSTVFVDIRVPFTYTLQARYLVNNPIDLTHAQLLTIVALKLVGYYIFRGSNGQKDAFRSNSDDPALSRKESKWGLSTVLNDKEKVTPRAKSSKGEKQ